MTGSRDTRFDTDKQKMVERLESIEEYIKDGKILRSQLNDTMTEIHTRVKNTELMLNGDPQAIDKYTRNGLNRRLDSLEDIITRQEKNRETLIQTATGAIAIAVGGAFIWLFNVIRTAFVHGPKI